MLLCEPITLGHLSLRNRLMRSATAERLADPDTGHPRPPLATMYHRLAEGGVGLIVTGHAYVERTGKAHPEMSSMAEDSAILPWRATIAPAQERGARVIMQINHGGASCDPLVSPLPLSPSGVTTNRENEPRMATEAEIERIISAFGQAARRAREAGFDGVQIHGAHGYLVSQFLMPQTNQRQDKWGGDEGRRFAFLRGVVAEIGKQAGTDYPLWIKLGVASEAARGLTVAEGARIAAACAACGIEAIEISNALGVPPGLEEEREARYLPMGEAVRQAVGPRYPLALVNWFRSREVMERTLASGLVQLISICRPLIAEPDLPRKLCEGRAEQALCVSCGRCWPENPGDGVDCHNVQVRKQVSSTAR